jgi:hypothetical protein
MIRAAIASLLLAAAAQAQVNADRVEVTLRGAGCENIGKTIQVVINGHDQNPFALDRVNACTWRGASPEPFDLRGAVFSLRLRGARTQVHRIFGTASNQSVARLQFVYVPAAFDIGVEAHDSGDNWLDVGYVRHVLASAPEDVEYDERGQLTHTAQHRIADVSFDAEELRLRLMTMRGDAPGLLVNPLLKKSKRAVFDGAGIVDALQRQAKSGQRRSAPSDSLAARKADERTVRDSRIKRLEVTVP